MKGLLPPSRPSKATAPGAAAKPISIPPKLFWRMTALGDTLPVASPAELPSSPLNGFSRQASRMSSATSGRASLNRSQISASLSVPRVIPALSRTLASTGRK